MAAEPLNVCVILKYPPFWKWRRHQPAATQEALTLLCSVSGSGRESSGPYQQPAASAQVLRQDVGLSNHNSTKIKRSLSEGIS